MRGILALPVLLIPLSGVAQDNPFQPGRASSTPGIFAPVRTDVAPPPVTRVLPPPPLPVALEPAETPAQLAKVIPSIPECHIEVKPQSPRISDEGGQLVLQVVESSRERGCIAGIESHESWVKIRHFNGRELTLAIDPNSTGMPREADLILASTIDSKVLTIRQGDR